MKTSAVRNPGPRGLPSARPFNVLQRKCGCGANVANGAECAQCRKQKNLLQREKMAGSDRQNKFHGDDRRASGLAIGATDDTLEREADRVADEIVRSSSSWPQIRQRSVQSGSELEGAPFSAERVLDGPGRALDIPLRQDMERRFRHDFSRVRVHTDAAARAAARDVDANAYTVGDRIVFGDGQFRPDTAGGRRLLAHELTHVIQQSAAPEPSVAQRDDKSGAASEAIPVDLVPVSPDENKKLKEMGVDLPKVSEETWRDIGGISDNAGKSLSEKERKKIERILNDAKLPPASPLAGVSGNRFLLHDTSSEVGAASIQEQQRKGRGPMGSGVSAYVPRDVGATVTRPNFYESRRPSTTEYEKGIDIIKQADRESALRDVWKETNATTRAAVIDRALADLGLNADEITTIKNGAESFLKGADTKVDGAKTAAAWAVGEICARIKSQGAAAVAEAKKEKELAAACEKLQQYFAQRPGRVGSLVTVEIVQVGTKSAKGNQNTCDPNNPNVKPMPDPPYTDNQYVNVALLYLRAALTAGRFPETTTHFLIDAFDKGHCDPRCFDLMKLYDTIAVLLGHGKGSTYGVRPKYGRTWGTSNVWWDDKICGKAHP